MAAVKSCASSSPPTPPAAGPHGSRRAPIFSAALPALPPAPPPPDPSFRGSPPPPPAAAAIQQWLPRVPELNVAAWLRTAADRFNRVADETGETDSIARLHLLSVFGVLLVAALIYAPHPPRKFRAEFDPKVYPAAALATLRTDPAGRIFTHDQWGD